MGKSKGSTALARKDKVTSISRPMEDWEQKLAAQAKEEVAKEVTGLPRITKKANIMYIDGTPVKDNKLRAVIVDYIFTHTYFKKKYVEGKSGSPDCYAYGTQDTGLKPFTVLVDGKEQTVCRDPQAPSCDGCEHNAYKTAENGKGKRCPGGRKIALVVPNDDPDSLTVAEMRVLTANSGSLKNWGGFMRACADVTPSGSCRAVVTEITVEPKGQVFVYAFKPVERLAPEMGPKIMALQERARTALMQPWPEIDDEEAGKASKPPPKRRAVKGQ